MTLLAAVPLVILIYAANRTITERAIARSTDEFKTAAATVGRIEQEQERFASRECELIADRGYLQTFFRSSWSNDAATERGLAAQAKTDLGADFLILTHGDGIWRQSLGIPIEGAHPPGLQHGIAHAEAGTPYRGVVADGPDLYLVVCVPMKFAEEVLGSLAAGYRLDNDAASSLASLTTCSVGFVTSTGSLSGASVAGRNRRALQSVFLRRSGQVASSAPALERIGADWYIDGVYPLSIDGQSSGWLVLQQSWEPTERYLQRVNRALIGTGLVTLVIALVGGLAFSRRISRPLHELAGTAEQIAAGQWDRRAPVRGVREATVMAAAFNEMAEHLAHYFEEARQLNETLERKVQERTAQLRAANEELEAFSYSVSHDLRAPLRAIDGFSRAILEDYGAALDSPGQKYLERVRSGVTRMSNMIEDLLKLARTSRDELIRERVDLSSLAAQVVADLRARDSTREITIDIQPGIEVSADPRLLRTVLENLAGNSWKYTSRREHPCIQIGRLDDELFVRDNGAGFDMANAHRLFGAFQRLHTDAEFEGSGIGLATVRRIIHRHGGNIRAESEPGNGSTFCFTLGE